MSKAFSSGLEYRMIAEDKLSLCGIGSCIDEHIVVPPSVGGISVVSVDSGAFRHNSSIVSIALPDSIDYVGAEAFAWCRNLRSVRLDGVIQISDRAFMGCDLLSSVDLGRRLSTVSDKTFAYCINLSAIRLPDSLQILGASVFEGCRALKSISIPENVKVIESGAFYACCELESIRLPRKLEYIDEFAFAYCVAISDISLPARAVINQYAFFEAKNGRLAS